MSLNGVSIRRRRRRRGELVAQSLKLSNYTIPANTPQGVLVANITNKIAGSTLSLVDTDYNRFLLSGTSIYAGPVQVDPGSPRLLTLLETQPDGVKQQTNLSMGVGSQVEFDPSYLFTANEPGLWFDPSDFSTMFQDRGGVTPVTAVGQPVGLILDKSRPRVLGTLTNVSTANTTGWAVLGGGTISSNGTSITLTNGAAAESYAVASGTIVAGKTYIITYTVVSTSSGSAGSLTVGANRVSVLPGGVGTKRIQVLATDTSAARIGMNTGTLGDTLVFRDFSIQEVTGIYAQQATSASRPILGRNPSTGTRNLAVGSADVTNASSWASTGSINGITLTKVGSGTDVDGLPYVDVRYQGTATGTYNGTAYVTAPSRATAVAGQKFTSSVYVKLLAGSSGNNDIRVVVIEETAPGTYINGTASVAVPISTEQKLSATRTFSTGNQVRTEINLTFLSGAVIDATYRIKGLQLELGDTATNYQRNLASYDVTETGVPSVYYLAFDGVDDFLVTNTVTPGVDKAQIFAGVRKLSDAGSAIIAETSVDASSNLGVVGISGPPAAVPGYGSRSKGSLDKTASATVGFASPITNVVSMMGDIANDSLSLRANGVEIANNTGDQGTGNFLAYPIYIGRRGGSSLPFNGRIYSLIVRFGPNLSARYIYLAENWMNFKTGAYSSVTPSSIFTASEPGVWFDPSDFSTMFQDNTGITPVTAVGQPIGLILDKSKSLVLGAEVLSNGSLQDVGTPPTPGTYNTSTGIGSLPRVAVGTQVRLSLPATTGSTYLIDIENTGTSIISVRTNGVSLLNIAVGSRITCRVVAVAGAFQIYNNVDGTTANFKLYSAKAIAGNHATQATVASCPILGRNPTTGTRNLAIGSADVTGSSLWTTTATQNGITATKIGSGTDTDGLPYVDVQYQGTATGTFHSVTTNSAVTRNIVTIGQTYTASMYAVLIAGSTNNHGIRVASVEETASPYAYIGQTSSSPAGATETRLTATRVLTTGNQTRVEVILQLVSGTAIDATYRIKGLQLELGTTPTAYQRNSASYDVTETGVPSVYYLSFDGVDDFLVTSTITPGTDKVQVFTGIRKLSDASVATVIESGTGTPAANNFTFHVPRTAGVGNYGFVFRPDVSGANLTSVSTRSAPDTAVLTGTSDFAGDLAIIKVNGIEEARSIADFGTGSLAANAIYIGRRGGTLGAFGGRIYSIVTRFGTNLSTSQISDIERYVNSKTRAY